MKVERYESFKQQHFGNCTKGQWTTLERQAERCHLASLCAVSKYELQPTCPALCFGQARAKYLNKTCHWESWFLIWIELSAKNWHKTKEGTALIPAVFTLPRVAFLHSILLEEQSSCSSEKLLTCCRWKSPPRESDARLISATCDECVPNTLKICKNVKPELSLECNHVQSQSHHSKPYCDLLSRITILQAIIFFGTAPRYSLMRFPCTTFTFSNKTPCKIVLLLQLKDILFLVQVAPADSELLLRSHLHKGLMMPPKS